MSKIQDYGVSPTLRQWTPVIFVLAIGMALSTGAFMVRSDAEHDLIVVNFQKDAALRVSELEQDIELTLEGLESIRSFFLSSEGVTRQEFRKFVEPMLARHKDIRALEWMPRVTESQRSSYVESARKDGLTDFQFTERAEQGRMIRAQPREEYFPVYFVEPIKGNEAAIGFDVGSDSTRRAALNNSRDTGEMVATARITLVQEKEKQFGFLAFCPVYDDKMAPGSKQSRREILVGFISGVFRIGDIVRESLEYLPMDDYKIHIFDLSAREGQRTLFVHEGESKGMAEEKRAHLHDLTFTETIAIAERQWEIFIASKPGFMAARMSTVPWMMGGAVMALSLVMAITFFINVRRNSTVRAVASDLRQLIETANAPIFGVDTEGNINEWNQMVARITGYGKDEVIGKNFVANYITAEYRASVKQVLDNALKGNETDNYQVPLFTKDGARVMVLLNATTRRDSQGNIVGVVGVGQDITELSEHRENLEELINTRTDELNQALGDAENTRDRIDGILKSVADGLIVTDTSNRVVLMNRAAEDLLGVRFSEVIDRPLDFAIPDKALRDKVTETLDKKTTGYLFDFELPADDPKHSRIMRARTSIIYDRDSKESGIVTIIHDVTHEREVDRMKTEFISTAAHELRTPLTSIQGFAEILLTRDNLSPDEKKKFLTYMNKQAVSLAGIVDDLLDISRIESGRGFALNKIFCNAGEAMRQVISYFQEQYKKHKFEMSLPENPVELYVDKDKMGQVYKNLLRNAVKYSPDGGLIRVVGAVLKDQYCVSIEDEGIGMTPEQVDRVFDKFYRVDASDTAIEGTGLGMTIVKHIVEAHGGTIRVESEFGKGTTVRFTIPLQS